MRATKFGSVTSGDELWFKITSILKPKHNFEVTFARPAFYSSTSAFTCYYYCCYYALVFLSLRWPLNTWRGISFCSVSPQPHHPEPQQATRGAAVKPVECVDCLNTLLRPVRRRVETLSGTSVECNLFECDYLLLKTLYVFVRQRFTDGDAEHLVHRLQVRFYLLHYIVIGQRNCLHLTLQKGWNLITNKVSQCYTKVCVWWWVLFLHAFMHNFCPRCVFTFPSMEASHSCVDGSQKQCSIQAKHSHSASSRRQEQPWERCSALCVTSEEFRAL